MHELDPRPLREVQDWLAPYAEEWERRLERLRRHLEPGGEPDAGTPDPKGGDGR